MGGSASWQRRAAWRACALLLGLAAAFALTAHSARAIAPPSPWDGVNPFRCTIQDAGQGTTVPDPGADPYCVRFDKSNQNVTQLGLITFLTGEPARFAAAGPKCFYYQEDHWRGSVIQSDQQTVIYEFWGHYFFNKATGDGGVWVTGFSIAGQTFDPRTLPGFPPQYDQYFGPGTGGFITHNDVPVDPNCVAQASGTPGAIYASDASRCIAAYGGISRNHIGKARLGMTPARVRDRLGPARSKRRGFLRYCLDSGGTLLVGGPPPYAGRAHDLILMTTGGGFALRGRGGSAVAVGDSMGRLRAAFPHLRWMLRSDRSAVYRLVAKRDADDATNPTGTLIAGVRDGRVAYLATYDARAIATSRRLAAYLRRAR